MQGWQLLLHEVDKDSQRMEDEEPPYAAIQRDPVRRCGESGQVLSVRCDQLGSQGEGRDWVPGGMETPGRQVSKTNEDHKALMPQEWKASSVAWQLEPGGG